MTITDKALIERDVGCAEYRTTLTAAISVTLDGRNTIEEAGTIQLTNNDICFTKDITCCSGINLTSVITYAASPTATIDVTCHTAFDIGIGRSDERLVEVISSYVVSVVYRTNGTSGIEVLGYLTTQQGDVGCSVNITSICSICVTQAATVSVGTTKATIIHIAADVSTFVDDHIGVVFLAVSGCCQSIVQSVVGIACTDREVNVFGCRAGCCGFCISSSICFCCPCIDRLLVHHAT